MSRLTDFIGRLMFHDGRVVRVETPAPGYRRFTLEIPSWRGKASEPGSNFRVALPGMALRTYTLLSLDDQTGQAETLVYLHGEGPASLWAADAQAGDALQVFGPEASRRATRLAELRIPTAVFGDETSFGIASIACRFARSVAVFEVDDVAAAKAVLTTQGLGDALVIERQANGGHLNSVANALNAALGMLNIGHESSETAPELVLTGQAQSIQTLRAALKQIGVSAAQTVKPHWATGKKGLD
jgi:NADPH-dependent ferric siderophore reductase